MTFNGNSNYFTNPKPWTKKEKEDLIRLYGEATREEIVAALSGRRWDTIKQYATRKMKLNFTSQPASVARSL